MEIAYEYGIGFRDKNTANLDHGILGVRDGLETGEQRKAIGPISIHGGDLLISGKEMFGKYITQKWKKSSKWIDMGKMGDVFGCGDSQKQ